MAPLFVARHYSTPSWTPVLLSVTLIGCGLLMRNWFEEPAWALVIGVWLGGVAQMVVLTWAMHKHVGVLWPNFDLRHPAIRKCALLLAPVIIGQSAGPINKWVNTFFAVSLGTKTVAALTVTLEAFVAFLMMPPPAPPIVFPLENASGERRQHGCHNGCQD